MSNRPVWNKLGWNVALIAAGLLLGFFFAAQWNVAPEATTPSLTSSRESLSETIFQLEREQSALKNDIGALRAELERLQRESAEKTELFNELSSDLEAQRAVAGLRPLYGPGIRIALADSAVESIPVNADPSNYILHDYDLRDVIHTLWASNAEAIAVNDERVVSTTAIYCVGSTVMVNDTRLAPPYDIKAIGDPGQLERALNNPATLKDLKARAKVYGLQFRVTRVGEVTLPAFRGSFAIRYAGPAN